MGIRLKGVEIDRDFLYFFLQSREFSKFVLRSTVQTGLPHINLGLLRSAPILLPPIFDQRSIAKILLLWDDAVERLTLQIGRKQQAFAYLREVLIHGARRLNHRKGSWPIVELGDVTGHLTDRNGTRFRRDSVMGVTKADGLVPMKEHVIADDIARYLIVPPMAFAYNPMRINIGSITMSEFEEDVIVSPDYVVFACNATRLLPSFLNHLRWTKAWSDFMTIAGNGSVRVRIYYASLADFEFHLPPLDEQRAIVGVLDDAEREVRALRAERAALEKQRDALATELLTGRLRVRDAARAALVG
jgi:type I restriction enzyme S subunit